MGPRGGFVNDLSGSQDPLLGLDQGDVFLKLSALLTGVADLDPLLGMDYLSQLQVEYGGAIKQLCELYYTVIREPNPVKAIEASLSGEVKLLEAAKQIVKIWYLSQFVEAHTKKPVLAG